MGLAVGKGRLVAVSPITIYTKKEKGKADECNRSRRAIFCRVQRERERGMNISPRTRVVGTELAFSFKVIQSLHIGHWRSQKSDTVSLAILTLSDFIPFDSPPSFSNIL